MSRTEINFEYDDRGQLVITVEETRHYTSWEDYHADGWPPLDDDETSGGGGSIIVTELAPIPNYLFAHYREWNNMLHGTLAGDA